MDQTITIIFLIFLCLGIVSMFFGKEILTKMNIIKADAGYDRIIRISGFVVSIISLTTIYFFGR